MTHQILNNYLDFLDQVFNDINRFRINIDSLAIDHIAYMCSSTLGLDHIEFVIPMGFQKFIDTNPKNIPWDTTSMTRLQYPHLKVKGLRAKFHELSIFETIKLQKKHKIF